MSSSKHPPNDSESEDDPDYVPPNEVDSDSEEEGEGSTNEIKEDNTNVIPKEDDAKKRAREALWADFQTSVSSAQTPHNPSEKPSQAMVKIEKKYIFAGKEVTEIIEVSEDSSDAKKWPLWKPSDEARTEPAAGSTEEPCQPQTAPLPKPTSGKRPGPRKPKTSLTPLPSSSQKAKKLTTLDKSAMDWRAHVDSHQVSKDELEANRRGGGYLEKMEFLKRVAERKEDALEANKSNKRRRL